MTKIMAITKKDRLLVLNLILVFVVCFATLMSPLASASAKESSPNSQVIGAGQQPVMATLSIRTC